MRPRMFAFLADEGQTMAEYAVTLTVITLAVVGTFAALALGIEGRLGSVVGFL